MQDANAASVAVIADDKVLLIRRAYAPYQNLWTLPGGRLKAGETAEECAVREVAEELGLAISGLRHVETQTLASVSGGWRLAVFATVAFAGEIAPSDEIADHRWVPLGEIKAMRTTSHLHHLLERAFAGIAAR